MRSVARLLLLQLPLLLLLELYQGGLRSSRARLLLLLGRVASWLLGLCHGCPGSCSGLVPWRLHLGLHA